MFKYLYDGGLGADFEHAPVFQLAVVRDNLHHLIVPDAVDTLDHDQRANYALYADVFLANFCRHGCGLIRR